MCPAYSFFPHCHVFFPLATAFTAAVGNLLPVVWICTTETLQIWVVVFRLHLHHTMPWRALQPCCHSWAVGRSGSGSWAVALACLQPKMDLFSLSLDNFADLSLRGNSPFLGRNKRILVEMSVKTEREHWPFSSKVAVVQSNCRRAINMVP